ncbi:MAG: biopolymer transporter ExbD [Pseudomonadota bacterium]
MSLRPSPQRRDREPTIALINIVFLMLVFFMVAGTLTKPVTQDLSLVSTSALDGRPPPNGFVLFEDGRIGFNGVEITDPAAALEGQSEEARTTVRIIPDRAARASDLVALGATLQAAGVGQIVIVTEQALR